MAEIVTYECHRCHRTTQMGRIRASVHIDGKARPMRQIAYSTADDGSEDSGWVFGFVAKRTRGNAPKVNVSGQDTQEWACAALCGVCVRKQSKESRELILFDNNGNIIS